MAGRLRSRMDPEGGGAVAAHGEDRAPYWPDSNGNFHLYDPLRPNSHVRRLLAEIDRDPYALFWG